MTVNPYGRRFEAGSVQPWTIIGCFLAGVSLPLVAAVLPEERFDALYHSYDGGGITIDGPSLSANKHLGNNFSLSGYYYVDSVSSASIDAVTMASAYDEERTEYGAGIDYLRGKTTLSAGYSKSEENDYLARTYRVGISEDFFGDLATLSLGYAQGNDRVGKNFDAAWEEEPLKRHTFTVSWSQVVTKNLISVLSFEATSEEGDVLNNPYRSYGGFIRDGGGNITDYNFFGLERYPDTRVSDAVAIRALYYLPYRAALKGEYRYYTDTWGIDAHTAELAYTHPLDNWTFDVHYRYYTQTQASFYNFDIDPSNEPEYVARDKELSKFNNYTLGVGLAYEFGPGGWGFFDRGSLNAKFDRIYFEYDNFYDTRASQRPDYPAYSFEANVIQLYLSLWY